MCSRNLQIMMAARFTTTHPGFPLSWLQKNSSTLPGHQKHFSRTLYIGRSSGKQDHCDLRHNDESWSELINTCSFTDTTNITCISIFYSMPRKKSGGILKKMNPEYLLEIG